MKQSIKKHPGQSAQLTQGAHHKQPQDSEKRRCLQGLVLSLKNASNKDLSESFRAESAQSLLECIEIGLRNGYAYNHDNRDGKGEHHE